MLWQVMKKAVAITPPTFFSSNTNLFQDSVAALNFGFTGVGVSPCAIAVSPVGVGIGATVSFAAPQNTPYDTCILSQGTALHQEELLLHHAPL